MTCENSLNLALIGSHSILWHCLYFSDSGSVWHKDISFVWEVYPYVYISFLQLMWWGVDMTHGASQLMGHVFPLPGRYTLTPIYISPNDVRSCGSVSKDASQSMRQKYPYIYMEEHISILVISRIYSWAKAIFVPNSSISLIMSDLSLAE